MLTIFAQIITLQAGEFNSGNFLSSSPLSNSHHHDHSHHTEDYFGFDFFSGWFDPVPPHDHSLASADGRSRQIHPLTIEAAFNDSDFFLDYAFNSFDDEDEHEIEIELELALTRRFGLIFETAYEFEVEDGSTEEGFGDLTIATRFVLAEFKHIISTANIEFGIPTGDDDFSADELVLEPSLLTWFDLGNDLTLNTALGLEIGTESNELSFIFDAAIVKGFSGPLALTLEFRNEVGLRDEEEGEITSEATLGAIYRFNKHTSVRAGWSFPISNDEFNGGAIASYNISF